MSVRRVQRGVRKKQILRIAARLFAAKGYHGMTIDELAEKLGMQKASLYYYIESKQALLEEISDTMIAQNADNLGRIAKSNLPPMDKLRQFIVNQIVSNTDSRDLTAIFFEEASSMDKVFYNRFRESKKSGERHLQSILAEGVEKGCFEIDDIKMASFLIFSSCNWVYKWYSPYGELTPVEIADKYIRLLENGYLHPKLREVYHRIGREGEYCMAVSAGRAGS
jgi:AcrR family transcriptional regulator